MFDYHIAGIQLLHAEALASLTTIVRETPTGTVTSYYIDIDVDYDDVTELNAVWQLPADILQQFREQWSSRRYAVRYQPATTTAEPVTTPETTTDDSTVVPFVRRAVATTAPKLPEDVSVACRQITSVKSSLQASPTKPMNPVIPEGALTKKRHARAVEDLVGCPRTHCYIFSILLDALQGPVLDRASLPIHVESHETRQYCTEDPNAIDLRDAPVDTHKAQSSPHWHQMASRYPTVQPTLVNVEYDGVTVYDSPTTSPVPHTG